MSGTGMIKNKLWFVVVLSLLAAANAFCAAAGPGAGRLIANPRLLPIEDLAAQDMPYDSGAAALLTWRAEAQAPAGTVYQIFASTLDAGGWIKVAESAASEHMSKDMDLPFWAWKARDGVHALKIQLSNFFGDFSEKQVFHFKIVKADGAYAVSSAVVSSGAPSNWFRLDRLNNLIMLILVVTVFFWAVFRARKGGLFIRRIAGLDAIDEAIGRATEMGKPIYYVPGIGGMSSISTIASAFILGEVSKKVAQYDSQIKVPHYDPIVMTVCKEVVKQSYLEAGRPDSYRDDLNFFVSQDQFSYAASVDGMISREKPAACFYMGYFMAESLLLAEVGATSGAIQIAGTDVESQLPFFFTACDYTLIGEELYAAGAYLSKEPMLLSALKVQDFGKLVVMVSVVFGMILVALGTLRGWDGFVKIIMNLVKAY